MLRFDFMSALLLISLGFTGCTVNQKRQFEQVKVGMEKDQVLNLVDSPQRTQRWQGMDRWTYIYYDNDTREEKEVHFLEGKATYVGEVVKPEMTASEQDRINAEANAQLDALAATKAQEARQIYQSYEDAANGTDNKPRYVPQFQPLE